MDHVVIIGNGVAGITAARHIRKNSDKRITVISSESQYFYSRTALMYVFMGHMRFQDTMPYEPWFWKKNRIDLTHDRVTSIDTTQQILTLKNSDTLNYDQLIIATGSRPRMPGIPGENLEGVQGLYHLQDLERLEARTPYMQRAVILGGGLIGVELAEMLLSRKIAVTFIVREKAFWGNVLPPQDAQLVSDHLATHHGLEVIYADELEAIEGDDEGSVKRVVTKSGRAIPAEFVGLTIGVQPNIDFLRDSAIQCNQGVLVDDFLQTSAPNVYAIGDCAEVRRPSHHRRAIEPVWYTGRMMGEIVAATITGEQTPYRPGVWFNSAKFFDVEYQTYGHVPAALTNDLAEYCWKHPQKELLIHFVFEQSSKRIRGVNSFGIRLRHELFDQWIRDGERIETVLTHLHIANFDPEFFKRYELEIVNGYNELFGTSLSPVRKVWWQKLLNR
jgi:NAD(P)H-nitrite reductase large subunit